VKIFKKSLLTITALFLSGLSQVAANTPLQQAIIAGDFAECPETELANLVRVSDLTVKNSDKMTALGLQKSLCDLFTGLCKKYSLEAENVSFSAVPHNLHLNKIKMAESAAKRGDRIATYTHLREFHEMFKRSSVSQINARHLTQCFNYIRTKAYFYKTTNKMLFKHRKARMFLWDLKNLGLDIAKHPCKTTLFAAQIASVIGIGMLFDRIGLTTAIATLTSYVIPGVVPGSKIWRFFVEMTIFGTIYSQITDCCITRRFCRTISGAADWLDHSRLNLANFVV